VASGLTPKLPLVRDYINDFLLITDYKTLVKQNFKNLILTNPGERIMDAAFGVGINKFLFELDNPGLYENISGKINEQVERYLPYVQITNAVYDSGATNENLDANFLFVQIEYIIKPLQTTDKLSLTLPND
jgi:phage baseplate assembly protein W